MQHGVYSVALIALLSSCNVEPSEGKGTDKTPAPTALSAQDAFRDELWPILKERCGTCHGVKQTPLFAVANLASAYNSFKDSNVINKDTPEKSRLVERLSKDSHNCWGNCQEDGNAMNEAVKKYAAKVAAISPTTIKTTDALKFENNVSGILEYDLGKLVGGGNIKLAIQVDKIDEKSLKFKNPLIKTDARLKVVNLKVLVNGKIDVRNATFTLADSVINPPVGALFPAKTVTMIVEMEKGIAEDLISWSFEVLEKN
jgi:hypothetical protein